MSRPHVFQINPKPLSALLPTSQSTSNPRPRLASPSRESVNPRQKFGILPSGAFEVTEKGSLESEKVHE